jgi:hypothetical protein
MWRNAARAMHLRTPAGAGLQTPNFNVVLQAKEAEVGAYEPISDDDMQDDNMVLAHAVLCYAMVCCAVLFLQAKGTEAGAYEPMSDDDMEDAEMGEARMEARQRGKRGKGASVGHT